MRTSEPASQELHSPLEERHAALGATFTDFAGWQMPLQYSSALAEHRAVREAAGIFDLSHMGEVRLEGTEAVELLNSTFVGDFSRMRVGKAKYTLLCNDQGGIVDDLIVYRICETEFLVVPNAANVGTVVSILVAGAEGLEVEIEDRTTNTALIAVQGPRAQEILLEALRRGTLDEEIPATEEADAVRELRYYAEVPLEIGGVPATVARTGYTGEDGFELFVAWGDATRLWNLLIRVGTPLGLVPAGLGARDSLRLEAAMPLCGHELSPETTPFEVGSGRVVALDKSQDFPGRTALERAALAHPGVVLVGLSADTRRAMRAECEVLSAPALSGGEARHVGVVTSGLFSPTLGHAIALARVEIGVAGVDTSVAVDVRGKLVPATVVPLPFYRRER